MYLCKNAYICIIVYKLCMINCKLYKECLSYNTLLIRLIESHLVVHKLLPLSFFFKLT